jgi:hypothetical protein
MPTAEATRLRQHLKLSYSTDVLETCGAQENKASFVFSPLLRYNSGRKSVVETPVAVINRECCPKNSRQGSVDRDGFDPLDR